MSTATTVLPSPEEVMAWLSEVPDPEIPVISVTELGIVRKVSHDGGHWSSL
nr:iron-sulfur cluster assembly protein [Marinicella sp. W31]MDC2878556.1 iron-sulfur cluster assembly protein [Marinicella sp. W31]